MGRNKILHDKSKIWISVIVGIVLLVTVCRIMFRLMGDVPAMEDIYFQAYNDQMQETVIYRYDADIGEVSEVGKVAGYFHNCKIDSEKKYITGVRSPWYPEEIYSVESGMESGILRYSLEEGTSVLLRNEQQMSIGKKEDIVWEYSFPFDNGEKMLMCYKDEKMQYLLYDLKTQKAKKIEVPNRNQGVYDIRNGRIWYPMGNRIMEYNAKTNEIREYLPDAGQCTISDDGRKVSYFKNRAKRIILYDTGQEKKVCTLRAGWNKTFGSSSPYSCGWEQSGNYFCYIEHFNKFFGSSDIRIKVYNLFTKTSKCIYLQRNAPAMITYEFIRNAD